MNASAIEFDVQMTKDNQLVIIHDFYVNRTTTGKGLVMEHNYDDLLNLDAGSWFDGSFSNERIPLLEQVTFSSFDHELLKELQTYEGVKLGVLLNLKLVKPIDYLKSVDGIFTNFPDLLD